MKIGKIIIPALLALGAIGGFSAAKVAERQNEARVSLAATEHDMDIDVGLNVESSLHGEFVWEVNEFYVTTFESRDVSEGDYLAFRIRSNNHAQNFFDCFFEVSGNCRRVPQGPAAEGVKCIPASYDGVAFDATVRAGYLPLALWDGIDVWYCIPKTALTRVQYGGEIDWSQDLSMVYFAFYHTNGVEADYTNYDIGDMWTANIDSNKHLVKINRLINWASFSGNGGGIVGAAEDFKLNLTRKNQSLKPAINMARAIMDVDACNATAVTNAYNAWKDTHAAFGEDELAYFNGVTFYDYADGDTAHASGKNTSRNMGVKWAAIVEQATGGAPSRVIYKESDNKLWLLVLVSGTAVMVFAALFINFRKKRIAQK